MEDKKLVRDCLRQDAEAQRTLYERYAGLMLGVCYRYTKSIEDAEDILQEGFVRVFRNLDQFKFEGELGAWIRRVMVTTTLNYLKKNRHYRQELAFDNLPLHPVSDDDPELKVQGKELAELIRQLPLCYQTIFNLHAIEGYSHVEIAQLLGISEGTSRSQYLRARRQLAGMINDSITAKKQSYASR